MRRRLRDLGFSIGHVPTGPHNAITDVPGVRVGHTTLIEGDGPLVVGEGPVRTGVTAVLPHDDIFPQSRDRGIVRAQRRRRGLGADAGGGVGPAGDADPAHQHHGRRQGLRRRRQVDDPALSRHRHRRRRHHPARRRVRRFVAERHRRAPRPLRARLPGHRAGDGRPGRRGIRRRRHRPHHLRLQIGHRHQLAPRGRGTRRRGGNVHLGNPGAVELRRHALAARRRRARRRGPGAAAGGRRPAPEERRLDHHVVATDAPLLSSQLVRLCKRAALGIGRVGSFAAHGSGEIIVGFSTANKVPRVTSRMTAVIEVLLDEACDGLYEAIVECTEEAIVNSLCMADEMRGPTGHVAPALPLDRLTEILTNHRAAQSQTSVRP